MWHIVWEEIMFSHFGGLKNHTMRWEFAGTIEKDKRVTHVEAVYAVHAGVDIQAIGTELC